jgi:hypothetical protein
MRKLLLAIALLIPACVDAQAWSGILTPPRATDWTQAGVIGGIPSGSWTQCGPTITAYTGTAATIINAVNHTGAGYTGCGSNTYVLLGPGTFNLSTGIRNKGVSNTELRGSGANSTFLVFTGSSTCQAGNSQCLVSFENNNGEYAGAFQTGVSWTAGYAQGTTSITVADASSVVANSTMLVLDQCDDQYSGSSTGSGGTYATCGTGTGNGNDNGNYFNNGDKYSPTGPSGTSYNGPDGNAARTHRFQEEFVLVTACSPSCSHAGSTTLTITPPLIHPNWASGRSPEYWVIQASHNIGLKNLSVDGSSAAANQGIGFNDVFNFWMTGVRLVNGSTSQGVGMYLVDQGEISSNYIYNSGQNTPGTDPNPRDPSNVDYNGSNILIANNILQYSRIQTIGNGPASGNVIAYNFMANCFESNGDQWGCIWDGHSNGADFNLFEGNVAAQVYQDQTHGTKLMETYYRNFITGWESCANGNCSPSATQKNANVYALGPLSFNRYGNFVANVLGTPGVSTLGYAYTNASQFVNNTTGYIYNIGSGNNGTTPAIPIDNNVAATLVRWGNWDTISGTRWCGNSSNTGWVTTCASTSEIPSGISVYPNSIPTKGDTGAAMPASFYYSSRPSWWSALIPFPAIGPDVSSGNVGQCTGTLNVSGKFAGLPAISGVQCVGTSLTSSWAGHVNAIPAMACALTTMGMPPDGVGSALTFNPSACFSTSAPIATFTPSSVNVGQVPAGLSSNPIPVTLQNTGNANLVVTTVSLGSSVFSLTSNTCGSPATITNTIPGTGFTLTPGQTCTFNIVYSPVIPNFTDSAFVSFSPGAANPDIFNLSGVSTGAPAPAPTIFAGMMSSQGTAVMK